MIATSVIIIITLLSVAHFYLKNSVLTSFATLISAVLAVVLAFNFYEQLANLLISRGSLVQWAQPGCFILLFVFGFAVIRILCDYLVGANIDFGVLPTRVTAVVCGIIVGVIISGMVLIAAAMAPVGSKWPYARFGEEGRTVKASNINPNNVLFNVDGLVTGLFSWISRGSLRSDKSFAVLQADFIDRLHLNRLKPEKKKEDEEKPRRGRKPSKEPEKEKVLTIAGINSIVLPKNAVRIRDDDNRTVVRMGIKGKLISDGGAMDENGKVSFTLSQVSLICKQNAEAMDTCGTAKAVYPEKYITRKSKRTKEAASLAELMTFSRTSFKGGNAPIVIAFNVPRGMTAKFLRFKQNVIVELPRSTAYSGEMEQLLDGEE